MAGRDGAGAGGGGRIMLSAPSCLETPAQRALDRLVRSGLPVSALRLYLSRLPGAGPHHHRVAHCLFDEAVRSGGGQVFTCGEADPVLMGAPGAVAALGAVLLRLFRAEAPGEQQLLGLWSLPVDEAALRAEFASAGRRVAVAEEPPVPIGTLAAVTALLQSAPPGELVRRQTAVRIEGRSVSPLFHELSVCFHEIEARLGMAVPLHADPYLFRHIAGQLDERMLQSLSEAELAPVPALHVKLSLSGAASPAFAGLRAAAERVGTVLGVELPFVEAVAEFGRFTALRDRLQAGGCRVVLDGMDHHALLQCDAACFGADLLKLEWSAAITAQAPREQRRLQRAMEALGTDPVVLCRADTEAALVWGLGQRITRFQGRHVDAMLAADRLTLCRHARHCSLGQCIERAAATDVAGQAGCANPALLRGVLHGSPTPQLVA